MPPFILKRQFIGPLAALLLLVGALASLQSVTHATHHAHHNAATHVTAFCAWMCAAGQIIESGAIQFEAGFRPPGIAQPFGLVEPDLIVWSVFASRGPPPAFL